MAEAQICIFSVGGIIPGNTESAKKKFHLVCSQAKVGKCNTPKPGFFDFEGQRKWYVAKTL